MMTLLGTPEYMAPEQAKTGQETAGHYNARHSDIWSSGVVLFVMLLGFFPFEVVDDDNPGFERQLQQVWAQQQDELWWKTRHVAPGWALLSPPCQDLLKRIFECDEERRITLEEIRAHEWYNQPLPAALEAGLAAVAAKQAKLAAATAGDFDPLVMHQRAKRLKNIVAAAAYPAGSEEAAEALGDGPELEGSLETWTRAQGPGGPSLVARVSLVRASLTKSYGRTSADRTPSVIPEAEHEGSSSRGDHFQDGVRV